MGIQINWTGTARGRREAAKIKPASTAIEATFQLDAADCQPPPSPGRLAGAGQWFDRGRGPPKWAASRLTGCTPGGFCGALVRLNAGCGKTETHPGVSADEGQPAARNKRGMAPRQVASPANTPAVSVISTWISACKSPGRCFVPHWPQHHPPENQASIHQTRRQPPLPVAVLTTCHAQILAL